MGNLFSILQGAYCGVVVGVSTTLWLAIGAIMYPPNKNAAVINVSGCKQYQDYQNMTIVQRASNYTGDYADLFNGTGYYYPAENYKQPE